ncbi:MAG: transglutaminase family protein [Fimbriimonadaceae bacterium]|nr:transglutaminase family protein [Alphaproteobacteria bacterium]
MTTHGNEAKTMDGHDPDFLKSCYFVESDAPAIRDKAMKIVAGLTTDKEKAIALFDMVRDQIRYDPYTISLTKDDYKATIVLARSSNWCVPKAILLTALARAAGIPAAVGFADVRNHLNTPKLQSLMGTDLFIYHGYTAFWLDERWVKATPAFNMEMCERFGVHPLIFDGDHEALFHEFNTDDERHMEYVNDRGLFVDAPVEKIIADTRNLYPSFAKAIEEETLGNKIHDTQFQHG